MALFHYLEDLDWIYNRQYLKVEKCSISILVFKEGYWKIIKKKLL